MAKGAGKRVPRLPPPSVEGEVPVELCNYTDVFYNRRIQNGMEFMAATATPVECSKWALMAWEVVRLGEETTHVGSGVTPRGGKSAYTSSGITFLRSQNVYFEGLELDDVVFIPTEIDDVMRRSRVQPNDVLLNITGASIGRCTVVPADLGPANVNQHVCIVRTTEKLNPRFVWKWLSTPKLKPRWNLHLWDDED